LTNKTEEDLTQWEVKGEQKNIHDSKQIIKNKLLKIESQNLEL